MSLQHSVWNFLSTFWLKMFFADQNKFWYTVTSYKIKLKVKFITQIEEMKGEKANIFFSFYNMDSIFDYIFQVKCFSMIKMS